MLLAPSVTIERQKSLWWAMLAAAGLFTALFLWAGTPGDWLRHAVFLALLGSAYLLERRVRGAGVGGLLLGCILLAAWHFADPQGFTQGQHLGTLGYGAVNFLMVLALAAYFGRTMGLLAGVLAAALLALLPDDGQRLYAILLSIVGLGSGLRFHLLWDELYHTQRALERAALTDALTGLGNRRALLEGVQNAPTHTMLTAWDLNDLKAVNDSQGHAAGDAYLLAFVGAWQQVAPPQARLFRIGGDEFVGLHPTLEHPETFIKAVQTQFSNVAAGWNPLEGDLELALALADAQLYRMKRRMKERV